MAKTNVLKYNADCYYPEALESGALSLAEMRAEYSRLRKIANRRIAALGRSEFADTDAYKKNVGKYTTIATLDETELRYKLYDLSKFVTARSGSVTGQRRIREQVIETFRNMGVEFINKHNYKRFTDFMEASRTAKFSKIVSSDRIKELFGVLSRHKIDSGKVLEDFKKWDRENLESKIDSIISAEANGAKAKSIRKMLDTLE